MPAINPYEGTNQLFIGGAFTLKIDPINRAIGRKQFQEIEKINKHVVEIETMFVDSVFAIENNNSVEYADIFEHYNKQYKSLCSYVKYQIKPTLVAINEHYFEREFKAEL
jgi:hypothetical protein